MTIESDEMKDEVKADDRHEYDGVVEVEGRHFNAIAYRIKNIDHNTAVIGIGILSLGLLVTWVGTDIANQISKAGIVIADALHAMEAK